MWAYDDFHNWKLSLAVGNSIEKTNIRNLLSFLLRDVMNWLCRKKSLILTEFL